MVRAPPYRQFSHADGRKWNIRLNGSTVELQITNDGDTVERRRRFDAPVLGARDLDDAVKEQLAEGFTEHTPPEWKRRLDEYQPPALDEAIDEEMLAYVAQRKSELPDEFA